jgi:hypothetical protein
MEEGSRIRDFSTCPRALGEYLALIEKLDLVHGHLDFYALLRMLRNPLAVHWTLLPLVG